jgi:UTP--glucose-1-phosphate uridylyltransferase
MSQEPANTNCKAFENASTNIAAAQMRNALTELAQTVKNPEEKKLFETEMDNFFSLFRRYLNDKTKGNTLYVYVSSTNLYGWNSLLTETDG